MLPWLDRVLLFLFRVGLKFVFWAVRYLDKPLCRAMLYIFFFFKWKIFFVHDVVSDLWKKGLMCPRNGFKKMRFHVFKIYVFLLFLFFSCKLSSCNNKSHFTWTIFIVFLQSSKRVKNMRNATIYPPCGPIFKKIFGHKHLKYETCSEGDIWKISKNHEFD